MKMIGLNACLNIGIAFLPLLTFVSSAEAKDAELMSQKTARQYFAPGESESRVVGSFEIEHKTRKCNVATGCTAWEVGHDLQTALGTSTGGTFAFAVENGKIQFVLKGDIDDYTCYVPSVKSDFTTEVGEPIKCIISKGQHTHEYALGGVTGVLTDHSLELSTGIMSSGGADSYDQEQYRFFSAHFH